MRIENKEEYKNIPVSALGFSVRTFNCLVQAQYGTLYLILENIDRLPHLKNMGVKSVNEVVQFANELAGGRDPLEIAKSNGAEPDALDGYVISALPESVLERHVTDMNLSNRVTNCLQRSRIETIRQLDGLKTDDILGMKNMGVMSAKQLINEIILLCELGEEYFLQEAGMLSGCGRDAKPELQDETDVQAEGKGFDFQTIDILVEKFRFKPGSMMDWFGLSRQAIYNALEVRSHRRSTAWTGKSLTESEHDIITSMVGNGIFDFTGDNVICKCINDRTGDLACIFIYDEEIKCFFLKDLPEDLQRTVTDANYHRYTSQELSGGLEGRIVYILTKPYFLPENQEKFRANAVSRNMKTEDYSVFITGYPLADSRTTDDTKIKAYLEERLTDGKVYIPSGPESQWIRSIASRNGYSISDLVRLYGYEPLHTGDELTAEGARKRHVEEMQQYIVHDNVVYLPFGSHLFKVLRAYCSNKGMKMEDYLKELGFERTMDRPVNSDDKLEKDMQVRECGEDTGFAERVFNRYPLLGSRVINQSDLSTLNKNARMFIDAALMQPLYKIPEKRKMEIVLAVVNIAKNWKSEDDSKFWSFICLQLGYRWVEVNDPVENILKGILEEVIKKNNRLFIEDRKGRGFKSTLLVHALSTKRSWMYLFDFLFDFYRDNLNWKVIEGDPLIAVMVRALQKKLKADNAEDVEISISSKAYCFQEGIRKLVLARPGYSRILFEKLLKKIDDLVNNRESRSVTYEELLCEEWYKAKINEIANKRRTEHAEQGIQRDVIVDYTKIRAKLILEGENEVRMVLPEIRLEKDADAEPRLSVCYNGITVKDSPMSWYGNELGKTLHSVSVRLPDCGINDREINLSVRISCGSEIIFDSEETLFRRMLVFSGRSEVSQNQIKKGEYTLVLPQNSDLKVENADLYEIEDFRIPGLKAFFVKLNDGYLVNVDGRLVGFDSLGDVEIRVLMPAESLELPSISNEEYEQYFAYRGSSCDIILKNCDLLQQFYLRRNGERVDFINLEKTESAGGEIYSCPIIGEDNLCSIQVLDINDERLVFDGRFVIVNSAKGHFNREFYFSEEDYSGAYYTLTVDGDTESIPFGQYDDEVRIPYLDGELHTEIPKIAVEETTGEWMNGTETAWYIDRIPQSSMLTIKNPSATGIRIFVGEKDTLYDGSGTATIGNILHSYSESDIASPAQVKMIVREKSQQQEYILAQVYISEGFLKKPEFWTDGNRLFWDHGTGFIGKPDRTFTLTLYKDSCEKKEFTLDENTESIEIPEDMPLGNYRFEISIVSGNIFKREKRIIALGDCIVGDRDVLRFADRRIVIESVTDPDKIAELVKVKKCYIDSIEFVGVGDTSEGVCPVYSGTLYTDGFNGEKHEFSTSGYTNARGITKLPVNPVRIVYIGEEIMCITDSEGDGLYYSYRYNEFDKREYTLTDREPTKANAKTYSNADLYIYTTERIN